MPSASNQKGDPRVAFFVVDTQFYCCLNRLNAKAFGTGQWPIAEHSRQGSQVVFEQSTRF
jgi:nitrogen fixation protein FixH